jgi:RNA polymerase sigma factor (sigma-70 family)
MLTTKLIPMRKGNSADEIELLESLLGSTTVEQRKTHWSEFVRRYERLIASCVLKAMRRYGAWFSPEDIDDLVNDVWVTLLRDDLRKLRQYDASRGLRIASFVGLVATNVTIDSLRSRRVETTSLDSVTKSCSASTHVSETRDETEDRESARVATEALSRLSNVERAFVVEAFRTGCSHQELARSLGLSTNTIYSRKFKLRAKLARLVATLNPATNLPSPQHSIARR